MRMINVKLMDGVEGTVLVNPMHVVSVNGDEERSVFRLTNDGRVRSGWPIEAALSVLNHAMDS